MRSIQRWGLLCILAVSVVLVTTASASAPPLEWQKVLGGSGNEIAYSIQQTGDGGYILTGETTSNNTGNVGQNHGGYDIWVVKLDAAGHITWQRVLGGANDEHSYSIRETREGGYILTGWTNSNNTGDVGLNSNSPRASVWVVKLNTTGGIEWQQIIGEQSPNVGFSLRQVVDEGYILVGTSDYGAYIDDMLVVKLNATGNISWMKTIGGSDRDFGRDILQTPDGGFIILGYSNSNDDGQNHGTYDVLVVKLNATGDPPSVDWQHLYGGTTDDLGYSIQETGDQGFILVGSTNSNSTGDVGYNHGTWPMEDVWVVKLNETGGIEWQKVLGGAWSEAGGSIIQTTDQGYVFAGSASSNNTGDVGLNHGYSDVWIVKLNASGTVIDWQKLLGGSFYDGGSCIQQTADGGYILTGFTGSNNTGNVGLNHGGNDVWVVKLTNGTVFLIPLPGYVDPPTDPTSDGLYEDLNANGRIDFQDVVLFFEYMDWIGENEPLIPFDFNSNGRIDFNDIVRLFEEI